MRWNELAYRAVTRGLAEGIDLDTITAGGPDYAAGEVSAVYNVAMTDAEYGVGLAWDGTCVLIDDQGHGYAVPVGGVYEQRGGFAWQAAA